MDVSIIQHESGDATTINLPEYKAEALDMARAHLSRIGAETKSKTVKRGAAAALGKIQALSPAAIDADTAAAYVSLSRRTIDELERTGDFPRRRQLAGRRVGFLVRELDEWLESRPISDLLPVINCQYGRAGKPTQSKE